MVKIFFGKSRFIMLEGTVRYQHLTLFTLGKKFISKVKSSQPQVQKGMSTWFCTVVHEFYQKNCPRENFHYVTVMFHIYGSAYRMILHQKPKPLTIFCAQMVEVTAMKPIAFKEIAFLLSMVIFSDF